MGAAPALDLAFCAKSPLLVAWSYEAAVLEVLSLAALRSEVLEADSRVEETLPAGWFSPWMPTLEEKAEDSAAREPEGTEPAGSFLVGAF